uniref:Uncharacterized protein n=1 Tax=Phytophthora ramorum TaxID=164328 RepID=H3HCK7_PHYRM
MSKPACYLAILDCHRLGIAGAKDEVEARWSEFDRSTVVTLVIRHCTALQVPDSIGDFHLTTGIKIYNSTINDWGETAAVTNTNHPALIWLYFVRVHLPDGRLPEGVLAADFPGNLYDLEFTYTNVRELPDDLDSKWLIGTTVYFEYSELTSVPPVLLRLDPYSISLIGSPITEIPPELFEVPDMVYMYMGSSDIQALPQNSVVASALTQTRHKRVSVTVEALDAAIQGPHMDDTETETEDDSMDPSLINYAQQEAQPKQEKLFKSQPEPVTKEELAASLQRFENATEEAAAAIETGKSLVKIPIAFGNCRKTSANVLLILKRREFVDDTSACLYRDTLTKLAHIASDERAVGRIQAKALTQVMDQVETLLRLADEIDGTPSALSGAEVRSAQLKLGKYAEDNADSRLTKMHKYVESLPKRGLSGDRVEGPMKKLICDLHQEMNMYQAYQKFGLPPRSEERWAIFTEIAETLGDWIGRTAMTAQPPKVLKPMFRATQKFQKEFPGRVPSIFLK